MPLLFHGSHLTTRKVIEHVQLTVYIPQLTIHEPNINPLQVTTTRGRKPEMAIQEHMTRTKRH